MGRSPQVLFDKLLKISNLEFQSRCRQIPPSFETRKGKGKVQVHQEQEGVLTLFEKGMWQSVQNKGEIPFSNALRFRRGESEEILLEHLRQGKEHPVSLLTLVPIEKNLFKSLQPYTCNEDTYNASVLIEEHYLHITWRIQGPSKLEVIDQVYT